MTARQNQVISMDRAEFTRLKRRALVAAILWGIMSAFWAAHVLTWATPREVTDLRMESGCRWPTLEGEMTVVAVQHGAVVCWRWR